MSYAFVDHWYTFTDRQRIYQNIHDYIYTDESGIAYTTSRYPITELVDSVIDSYPKANEQLGFDFNNSDTNSVREYGSLISSSTNATSSQVMMILGIIEAGLKSGLISKPFLHLRGADSLHTPSVLDNIETVISKTAKGAGTVITNLGEGIVNTSSALSNLPVILGAGVILYYFLMIAPKTKKG
jgi:hypothetical protein